MSQKKASGIDTLVPVDCERSITIVNPQTTYLHGDATAELDYLVKLEVKGHGRSSGDIIYVFVEDLSSKKEAARHVGIHKLLGLKIAYTKEKRGSSFRGTKEIVMPAREMTPASIAPYIDWEVLGKIFEACDEAGLNGKYTRSCPALAVFSHYSLAVLARKYASIVADSLCNLATGAYWDSGLPECIQRYSNLLNPLSGTEETCKIVDSHAIEKLQHETSNLPKLSSLVKSKECRDINLFVVLQFRFHAGLDNPEEKGYGDFEAPVKGLIRILSSEEPTPAIKLYLMISEQQKKEDLKHAEKLLDRFTGKGAQEGSARISSADLCVISDTNNDLNIECKRDVPSSSDCALVVVLYDFKKSMLIKLFKHIIKDYRDGSSYLIVIPRMTYRFEDSEISRLIKAVSIKELFESKNSEVNIKKKFDEISIIINLESTVEMLGG